MSAQAGWYPDPGGAQGLYRYWDGRAWSAATSPNPAAPAPTPGLGAVPPPAPATPTSYGSSVGTGEAAQGQPYGQSVGQPSAYANYQAATTKRKTPIGWWLGIAALLLVIVVVSAFVIRGLAGGGDVASGSGGGQATSRVCPPQVTPTTSPPPQPQDGRVHGGPVSYPRLGAPWGSPRFDYRVPFGNDVQTQDILVEPNYQLGSNWVASVLVAELAAGDGFFTPEQGSQIVVRCILGEFYGDNEVASNVKVDRATTIDGHQAWLVESQLTFDIEGLRTKGELLIVAIVATGSTAGLFYASIPDTRPELVQPARDALKNLKVDS